MRAAPAVAIVVVGAALCGGALELLVPGGERQTMGFDEVVATLGAWLLDRFMALARIMKRR
ncbi:MAG: hypothetical protein CMP07_07525 [Xanthomonadales bacterium]|nr:hypothetical protein [Xanthomonadales bacterium]|tara:strand:+ start:355 stop:537 length:183 start_codon:yes stop_codon:yes gene_type:complete